MGLSKKARTGFSSQLFPYLFPHPYSIVSTFGEYLRLGWGGRVSIGVKEFFAILGSGVVWRLVFPCKGSTDDPKIPKP